jgi:3-oxoacyl-[acyl-carrier-protein] synthase II
MSPLAITGMSSISGLGIGTDDFEHSLFGGVTAIAPAAFDVTGTRSRRAARIVEFDASEHIPAGRLRRIDRIGQLAVAGSRLALQDAGLDAPDAVDRDRTGIVMGSTTAGLHTLVTYLDGLIARGPDGASPMDFSNTVGNAAASLCGIELGLRGINVTVNYKEVSAAAAVAYAATALEGGQADAVITGGVEDIESTYFAVHDSFGCLAYDDGAGEASRPFDRRRNGFVLGTGTFLLVLETVGAAAARAATPRGHLVGMAAASGPCRLNNWPDEAAPLARCMRAALQSAGIAPDDVAVVLASANSTPTLDRIEAEAIADVFGAGRVPVASVKGALGESGASAAAAIQAALLALRSRLIPPTVGFEQADETCPVDVSPAARALPAGRGPFALANSFGSGGANYSLVVRV